MESFEKHVLIVAGGNSSRMANNTPKQFRPLCGSPLLYHTFDAFKHIDEVKFTLVLQQKHMDIWKQICANSGFSIPHKIVAGGPTRFHSVKAGLANIPNEAIVLIHDAARPFPSYETISNVINICQRKGNAIPAINIVDSIREVTGAHNKVINRNLLMAIQTPQGFQSTLIKEAYNQPYNESFTDDATVLESSGISINIVKGNAENIKITTQDELAMATGIIENRLI